MSACANRVAALVEVIEEFLTVGPAPFLVLRARVADEPARGADDVSGQGDDVPAVGRRAEHVGNRVEHACHRTLGFVRHCAVDEQACHRAYGSPVGAGGNSEVVTVVADQACDQVLLREVDRVRTRAGHGRGDGETKIHQQGRDRGRRELHGASFRGRAPPV